MLDYEHAVAEIAQMLQRREKLCVVALVQADRRLVEDVGDADEAAPDLGRQADALALAAGKGPRRAGQTQVVEADVHEKAEARVHLPEDGRRDGLLICRELQRRQILLHAAHGLVREVVDILAADRDRE